MRTTRVAITILTGLLAAGAVLFVPPTTSSPVHGVGVAEGQVNDWPILPGSSV